VLFRSETGGGGGSKKCCFGFVCCLLIGVVAGMIAWIAVNSNQGDTPNGTSLIPPSECLARNGTISDNKCYLTPPTGGLPFDAAQAFCVQQGGNLVTIWDDTENAFVLSQFKSMFPTDNYLWIGLNDYIGGQWTWTALYQHPTYLHWAQDQPSAVTPVNGQYMDCVAMNTDGFWLVATSCNNSYPYMCKFPLASPPSPPLNVVARATVRGASLVWDAPVTDGGRTIDEYRVFDPTGTQVGSGSPRNSVVTNLIPDMNYTFTVVAVNSIGVSQPSLPSNAIFPSPSAPDSIPINCVAGNQYIAIDFVPGYDGGRPITSWTIGSSSNSYSFSEYQSSFVVPASNGVPDSWNLTINNVVGSTMINCPSPLTPSGGPAGIGYPVPVGVTSGALFRSSSVQWPAVTDVRVTGYQVVLEPLNSTLPSVAVYVSGMASSSTTVSGLVTGMTYHTSVAACSNTTFCGLRGYGPDVTPMPEVPDPPTNVVAVANGRTALVTWILGADGDSPILYHDVVCTPVPTGPSQSSRVEGPVTQSAGVTSLTVNTNYTCTVSASNMVGPSSAVSSNQITTEVGSPSEPINVTATAGGRSASIIFLAPGDDGFSANLSRLISFTIRSISVNTELTINVDTAACPNIAAFSQCGPVTFNGLVEGIEYRFTVEDTNDLLHVSAPSLPSNAIIALPVSPRAPLIIAAFPGRKSANVSWVPPTDDGGAMITGYVVTSNGTRLATTDMNTTSVFVPGLTPNQAYIFNVFATNMIGDGLLSANSAPVPILPDVPAAPQSLSAVAGDKQVKLTFVAPDNGGSAIINYTAVDVNDTSKTFTGKPDLTNSRQTLVIAGLLNGQAYRFQVYASNIVGDGPLSDISPISTPNKKSLFKQWALAVGLVLLILAIIVGIIVGVYYMKENKMYCWDYHTTKDLEKASAKDKGDAQELTSKGPTSSPQASPMPQETEGQTTSGGGGGAYPDLGAPAPATTSGGGGWWWWWWWSLPFNG